MDGTSRAGNVGETGRAVGAPPEGGAATPRRRGRLPVRGLSLVVCLVLVAGSLALCQLSRTVVADQERRLLDQRANEATALISNLMERNQIGLQLLAGVASVTGGDPAVFSRAAASQGSRPREVALVESAGGRLVVTAAAGSLFVSGQEVAGPVGEAIAQAGATPGVASTGVFDDAGRRRLGLATAAGGNRFVYEELPLEQPGTERPPPTATDPFSDLLGAVYAAAGPERDQVVLSTGDLDRLGRTEVRTFPVGSETWSLEVASKDPLVGSLSRQQPWVLLAAGLLAALLVPFIIETLLRRRSYALALVAERTAELERSVADLDEAHKRLVEHERLAAIGRLASAVGHEMRNPLGVITNVLYLLATRYGNDPWAHRQLQTAEREVGAATLIVSDLLDFARPRQPVIADTLVEEVVAEVLSVAPAPSKVEVEVAPSSRGRTVVRADRDQLRQVLLNLVTNAYQAMPQGGSLRVAVDTGDGGTVRISVSDDGVGMDDSVRQHLFEPFFTTKVKGIGLGLVVTQRIVESHGGELIVQSEPGAGSTFTVALPAAPDLAAVAS